jgi:hypothetical protein
VPYRPYWAIHRVYFPSRYDDVRTIAYDTEHFSSRRVIVRETPPPVVRAPPITSDPPEHRPASRCCRRLSLRMRSSCMSPEHARDMPCAARPSCRQEGWRRRHRLCTGIPARVTALCSVSLNRTVTVSASGSTKSSSSGSPIFQPWCAPNAVSLVRVQRGGFHDEETVGWSHSHNFKLGRHDTGGSDINSSLVCAQDANQGNDSVKIQLGFAIAPVPLIWSEKIPR